MINGWLFDVYPLDDKIILWIKNKNTYRIEKQWNASLYVASDSKHKLEKLQKIPKILSLIKKYTWENKFEKVFDTKKSLVLRLTLKNSSHLLPVSYTHLRAHET